MTAKNWIPPEPSPAEGDTTGFGENDGGKAIAARALFRSYLLLCPLLYPL